MIILTPQAIAKVKDIITHSDSQASTLRLSVKGGGCSGFQYAMVFDSDKSPMDKEFNFDGLTVLVDGVSYMYLDGVVLDYIETLMASGFKFNNPNIKSTCGCGSSFSA